MKLNLTAPITDHFGKALESPEGPVTIRTILLQALDMPLPSEQARPLSAEQKIKNFRLAQQLVGADEVSLTAEDVSLLKARIGEGFTTLVVGRAFELLDP